MKTEPAELTERHWRWLRAIIERILPRGVREEYLDALDGSRGPLLRLALESAAAIADGYGVQAVAAFNKYAVLAQTGLVVFCLGLSSSLPYALLIGLGAILIALSLRDAIRMTLLVPFLIRQAVKRRCRQHPNTIWIQPPMPPPPAFSCLRPKCWRGKRRHRWHSPVLFSIAAHSSDDIPARGASCHISRKRTDRGLVDCPSHSMA